MMDSVSWYNQNAQSFYERTIHADMQECYQKFLIYLPKDARILDAGCGVGRDALFFQSQGYDAEAMDGSIEMVKKATHLLDKPVFHRLFQEMSFSQEFDAIWANASLLHVPYEDLREVLKRFHEALVPSGILYGSFKYGSSMRIVEDRIFFDMNEDLLEPYFHELFQLLAVWKSADTRSPVSQSPDKSWLHFIARKR